MTTNLLFGPHAIICIFIILYILATPYLLYKQHLFKWADHLGNETKWMNQSLAPAMA